jgi:hypothetical protein
MVFVGRVLLYICCAHDYRVYYFSFSSKYFFNFLLRYGDYKPKTLFSKSIFIWFIFIGIGSMTYLGSMISERALNEWVVTVKLIERRVDRYERKAKIKKMVREGRLNLPSSKFVLDEGLTDGLTSKSKEENTKIMPKDIFEMKGETIESNVNHNQTVTDPELANMNSSSSSSNFAAADNNFITISKRLPIDLASASQLENNIPKRHSSAGSTTSLLSSSSGGVIRINHVPSSRSPTLQSIIKNTTLSNSLLSDGATLSPISSRKRRPFQMSISPQKSSRLTSFISRISSSLKNSKGKQPSLEEAVGGISNEHEPDAHDFDQHSITDDSIHFPSSSEEDEEDDLEKPHVHSSSFHDAPAHPSESASASASSSSSSSSSSAFHDAHVHPTSSSFHEAQIRHDESSLMGKNGPSSVRVKRSSTIRVFSNEVQHSAPFSSSMPSSFGVFIKNNNKKHKK